MIEKIIIFPDIHGRDFWKAPISKYRDDNTVKFVFLGDYLDPYGFEGITPKMAWDNFNELLEETKDIPEERIVFLLGNHDLHYLPELHHEWGCRRIKEYILSMGNIINDKNKFKIAYEHKGFDGKKFLFTHAGVHFNWALRVAKYFIGNENPLDVYSAETLNSILELRNIPFLWMVSYERGGEWPTGSCIWADVHEHLDTYFYDKDNLYDKINIFQIFGHTLSYPTFDGYLIEENFAMLDAKKAFILDLSTNKIEKFDIN